MNRIMWTGLLLIGVLWALSACAGAAVPAASTAAPAPAATSVEAGATAVMIGGVTVVPASAADATPEAGGIQAPVGQAVVTTTVPLDLPKLQVDALTSYVATIQMRDQAVTAGAKAAIAPPTDMEMRYHAKPAPETYSWTTTGDQPGVATPQDFRMLMVDGQMYMFAPDQNKWVKLADNNPQNLPLKADILDPTHMAQSVPAGLFSKETVVSRDEKLDGVSTTHYRANPAQMQELLKGAGDENRTPVSGQADFWVANDLGYLKQYIMTANVQDKDKAQYRQTVKFTLTNENKAVQIATPAPDKIMSQQEFDQTMPTAGPPPPGSTLEPPPAGVPTAAP